MTGETSKTAIATTGDTKIKTDLKTIIVVIGGTISAVCMYFSVLSRIDDLGSGVKSLAETQKSANESLRQRINYLFHVTGTYNPFEAADYKPPASATILKGEP